MREQFSLGAILTPFQIKTITALQPFRAITSMRCIRMCEAILLVVAGPAKAMRLMLASGAATLDAGIVIKRPATSVFKVMKALVVTMRQYSQILRSVVQRVVVDVMHVLVPFEFTAKYLFQHQAMLKFPEVVRDLYLHVSEAVLAGPRAPRTYWAVNASGHVFDYINGGKK